jgi:hypothetical protein
MSRYYGAPTTRHEPYWGPVRIHVRCSFGHDVGPGTLVRFGLSQYGRRPATCAACMLRYYGIRPPGEVAEPRDGKAEALGPDR